MVAHVVRPLDAFGTGDVDSLRRRNASIDEMFDALVNSRRLAAGIEAKIARFE